MKRRIIAHLIVIILSGMAIAKQFVTFQINFTSLIFLLPYMISNGMIIIFLVLSLKNKPKEVTDSDLLFLVSLTAANLPILINLSGINLKGVYINLYISVIASVLSVSIIPLYLYAVINLGRNLSILPEANGLQTTGIYSFSRHPLYSTYIYWYVMQILIMQSMTIFIVSILQITFQLIRAKYEEKILEKNFPEYGDYKKKVGWFGKKVYIQSQIQ